MLQGRPEDCISLLLLVCHGSVVRALFLCRHAPKQKRACMELSVQQV